MIEPKVPYVHVHVEPEEVELASSVLWELGALGIEERDHTTIEHAATARPITLAAPFSDEARARAALKELSLHYDADLQHVAREDWSSTWKAGLHPTSIGRRLYLCPSWEPARPSADQVVVTMDPENAFGSGTHETTQLVLRELDRRVSGGERVLDVGCGSGILAIAALKLGAASALATDIDRDAVAVAERNARKNQVDERFAVSSSPAAALQGAYDLVVANIHAEVLRQLAGDLVRLLAPGGTLIVSGLLDNESKKVAEAYPLAIVSTTRAGEWVCLVLGRKREL